MKKNTLLLLLWLGTLPVSFSQDTLKTSGDNSPAVIAKNFSVVYGVRSDAVETILKIYEKNGLSPAERKSRTESLLKKYQQAPEKKSRTPLLSDASKEDLGIEASPALADALDWDLYAHSRHLTTIGANSPAVIAEGDVNIWYGIPPKALRALAAKLEEDKVAFENFQKKLDTQVERFKALEKELATRADYDAIAKQAKHLLNEGKIAEAEKLLEDDYEQSEKRLAYKAYELGGVKELALKYAEATKYLQKAVMLEPNNSNYLLAMGNIERTNGHYSTAIEWYEKALAIDTVVFKNQPEKAALLYSNLGVAWKAKGQYDRAIAFYEKALIIDSIAFGNKHLILAIDFNNLGVTWQAKDEYDRAIAFYEKALAIDSVAFGNKHPNVATRFNNLGAAWQAKGEYDRAIAFFEKALPIFIQSLGERHPNVASEYNNLGEAYRQKGEYDRAIAFFEKALAIDSVIFGKDHPNVAILYNNLGAAWQAKGEYDRAIAFFEKALPIFVQAFGEKHPNVAVQFNNLGATSQAKGEYDRAIAFFEKALAIDSVAFGKNHSAVAREFNNLGLAWKDKGEYDRAIAFFEKAFAIDSVAFGNKHPVMALDFNNLGSAWYEKGEYDRAIAFFEKALPIFVQAFGEKHPNVAIQFNNLGVAWQDKGEYDRAIAFFEKALAIDSVAFGNKHPNVATRFNNLGLAWKDKGEYDRAIAFFEKAQGIFKQFLGNEHPNTKTIAQNLSRAANDRGMEFFREKNYAGALPYFQKALENAEQAEDWVFSLSCLNNIGSMQKRLGQYVEGLVTLEKGLARAEKINLQIDEELKKYPAETLQKPEVQAKIAELKNATLIRRMHYHKAGCLAGLGRKKEADELYQQLLKEAREANDTRLLEDLKNDGVKD